MKRTREEYGKAIAILEDNTYIHPATLVPAIEAMRELRDSAFALEEALVNLTRRGQVMLDSGVEMVPLVDVVSEFDLILRYIAGVVAPPTRGVSPLQGVFDRVAAAPAPATPLQPHQSEEIMDNGEPEKFTGPSGGLPDAGNSTPGV